VPPATYYGAARIRSVMLRRSCARIYYRHYTFGALSPYHARFGQFFHTARSGCADRRSINGTSMALVRHLLCATRGIHVYYYGFGLYFHRFGCLKHATRGDIRVSGPLDNIPLPPPLNLRMGYHRCMKRLVLDWVFLPSRAWTRDYRRYRLFCTTGRRFGLGLNHGWRWSPFSVCWLRRRLRAILPLFACVILYRRAVPGLLNLRTPFLRVPALLLPTCCRLPSHTVICFHSGGCRFCCSSSAFGRLSSLLTTGCGRRFAGP